MLRFLQRRREDTIAALYGAIVAQARAPSFYQDYGVPDSVDGRFEMVVLHVDLVYRRLQSEAAELRAVGQKVFDLFCQDMDDNLREMGVSDVGVPRHMQRMGEAYYGRAAAYRTAIAADDNALALVLARNVLGAGDGPAARRLTAYVRAAERTLAAQPAQAMAEGCVQFPDPATI